MIHLSPDEKLLILIGCLIFVLLTAVIMTCKLAPFCWLYKYCPFRVRYDDEEDEIKRRRPMVYYAKPLPPIPDVKTTYLDGYSKSDPLEKQNLTGTFKTSSASSGGFEGKYMSLKSNVTKSSVSTGSFEDNNSVFESTNNSQKTKSFSEKSLSSSPTDAFGQPLVSFSLMYDEGDEKLSIFVNGVSNLEPNLLGNANDSFLRILLVKDLKRRWRSKSDIPLEQLFNAEKNGYECFEFRTQLIRRNLNPIFNEYFAHELKCADKNYTFLKFAVYCVDRFSQQTIVGECQMNVGKMTTNSLTDFRLPLKESRQELGEILVALTYLPTSQRLNVILIKGTNFKQPNKYVSINPFVKLIMLHKGKSVEKHRTSVQFGTVSPVFNEKFTFDLPATEVDKVTLLLMVFHQEATKDINSLDTGEENNLSSPSESVVSAKVGVSRKSSSTGSSARKRRSASAESTFKSDLFSKLYKSKSSTKLNAKYLTIGRVALGTHCKGTAKNHWVEVMCNPRKQIAQMHKLQQ